MAPSTGHDYRIGWKPAQRVWWHRSAIVGGALALASAFYAMGVQDGQSSCMEDEVYAVVSVLRTDSRVGHSPTLQIDTNPAHGLTWACENTEAFILRSK